MSDLKNMDGWMLQCLGSVYDPRLCDCCLRVLNLSVITSPHPITLVTSAPLFFLYIVFLFRFTSYFFGLKRRRRRNCVFGVRVVCEDEKDGERGESLWLLVIRYVDGDDRLSRSLSPRCCLHSFRTRTLSTHSSALANRSTNIYRKSEKKKPHRHYTERKKGPDTIV